MGNDKAACHSIDDYIAGFPAKVREPLEQVRATVSAAAPGAQEAIKYGIPTFVLNGNLIHFAAWKKHIGFYSVPTSDDELTAAMAPYAGPKGSLMFLLNESMPLELISRIVKTRIRENAAKAGVGGGDA